MFGVELVDDLASACKDFWALDGALSDRLLAVRTPLMKSEVNFCRVVIPIERILHLVAIEIILAVGNSR